MGLKPRRRQRETILTVALTALLGIGLFLFLMLMGGTFLATFLVTAATLTMIGVLHYVVWGRMFPRHRADVAPTQRQRG